jgi:catechol 2,3-dioxygenase
MGASAPTPTAISAATSVGAVALTVSDLGRSRAFYETVIGLRATELEGGELAMGVPGAHDLVVLRGDPSAPALDRRASGLFHLALLTASRRDLAHALGRLARSRWPLDGASDHLVSEALYLSDPDGNGIEIYRDRPRSEWTYDGAGRLSMASLRLDLHDLGAELADLSAAAETMADGTRMGHVHLQVSELAATEAFYNRVLGFDVVVRGYPGALFMSAGGYHHHIGLNTWNSVGSAPPVPGAIGLRAFDVRVPDGDELERVLHRVGAAGLPAAPAPTGGGAIVRDPSGNAVHVRRD